MTRGIVVGARIGLAGGYQFDGGVHAEDILKWILYWDHITYAGLGIGGGSVTGNHPQDISFLESEGIFETRVVAVESLDQSQIPSPQPGGISIMGLESNQFAAAAAAARIKLSNDLSEEFGNIWTIGQTGGEQLILPDAGNNVDLIDVKLTDCLPVPIPGTPFEDVLTFKERHKDELGNLRYRLDALRENILSSTDERRATDKCLQDISIALTDLNGALAGTSIKTIGKTVSLYTQNPNVPFWTMLGAGVAETMGIPLQAGISAGASAATLFLFTKRIIANGNGLPNTLQDFAYVYSAAKHLELK